jgi:VWFA-related protein
VSPLVVLLALQAAPEQQPRFKDVVTVERIVLDVRVVDDSGRAIPGLGPADFKVKLGGKLVSVESAKWLGAGGDDGVEDVVVTPAGEAAAPKPGAEPHLVVFLLQKDLASFRVDGFLRMFQKTERMLQALPEADLAAAMIFDSNLRLLDDFTTDRKRTKSAIEQGFLHGRHVTQEADEPSLARHFDAYVGKRVGTPEQALLRIGESLADLPGLKTLVLLGWGLGRFGRSGVDLTSDYNPARQALLRARCSVFSLDITSADYHSLEVGLQQVAHDTGGFYAKTNLFPDAALTRMEGALSGYYVVALERPEGTSGSLSLDISLAHRKGQVLAPTATP